MNSKLEEIIISDCKIFISLSDKATKTVIIHDGNILEKLKDNNILTNDLNYIGIEVPKRLSDYTPWYQKALKSEFEDFGGKADELISKLEEVIIPKLVEIYKIDVKNTYMLGYSLGGLFTMYYSTKKIIYRGYVSICGSFWYPNFIEYSKNQKFLGNYYVLNGNKEGLNHDNLLGTAVESAKQMFEILKETNSKCEFIEAGHHDRLIEKYEIAFNWIKNN